MEKDKMLDHLCDLAQLDIDAVHAYEEALKNIDQIDVQKNLEIFKNDHLRHITNLGELIRKNGGTPPERKKDFMGYIIQGFTSIRSITGTIGALKAMESNEVITNKFYKNALEKDFPLEIKEVIENNYNDEKHHIEYIRKTIELLNNK